MANPLPQVTKVYQNHHLDSTRWQHYKPRDDDIILTTSYKSGTTWMQLIMKYLLVPTHDYARVHDFSRWVGARWNPIETVIEQINTQTHRRCIKSHLPLDGLPYFPQVKYIIIARDARDVFMSFWNHYSNYTDDFYEEINSIADRVGDPLPRAVDDIHVAWRDWITKGWFEWESEGYPFWGNMHHTKTYWDYKHLPNILLVHYNNLLSNPQGEIKRIADYVGVDTTDTQIDEIVELTSFSNMKENSDQIVGMASDFKGGSKTFINKGTNGRWKGVLSDDELALYDDTIKRVLTPECAHWLETGQYDFNQ